MRRFLRNALLVILALLALGVGIVAVEFVLTRGVTPPIPGADAVASLETVRLGGVDQWILIRGHDRTDPVVLFLHGGPGMPAMYLAHAFQRNLERDFVVVHWDRRGAGKSFAAAEPPGSLTVRRTLDDLFELTAALRRRFGDERIVLIGHSWGSYLGLLAVRERPEEFSAFVGMGQIAGTRAEAAALRRDYLAEQARKVGDQELLDRLAAGGEPTEGDLFRHGGELRGASSFWPILRTGLRAPEYTLWDALNVRKGADLVAREMDYDVAPAPYEGEVAEVEVPVFFFLGRYDYNTPSPLAAEYLERLRAPLKELVWFERSAHFPFFEQPERFHAELLRAVVAPSTTGAPRPHTKGDRDEHRVRVLRGHRQRQLHQPAGDRPQGRPARPHRGRRRHARPGRRARPCPICLQGLSCPQGPFVENPGSSRAVTRRTMRSWMGSDWAW